MHELWCDGPSVLAVPGQTKRHQQHCLHKVSLMYFGVESNIMSFVLDKNLQRCGGAGHTTGDCMVGRPGHQVPPGTGPGIVPPDKWGAPGQVGQVPVSLLLNWL